MCQLCAGTFADLGGAAAQLARHPGALVAAYMPGGERIGVVAVGDQAARGRGIGHPLAGDGDRLAPPKIALGATAGGAAAVGVSSACSLTATTHTGTARPSSRYNVLGTMSVGSY